MNIAKRVGHVAYGTTAYQTSSFEYEAAACVYSHRANSEPVTIIFMDPESLDEQLQRKHLSEEVLRQFESETGIRVKHLPAPETSQGQLRLIRELLGENETPDVLGIDVVWPGLLDDALLDLKPFFSSELSAAELLRTRKPLFGKRTRRAQTGSFDPADGVFSPRGEAPVPEQAKTVQGPRYRVVVEITLELNSLMVRCAKHNRLCVQTHE